MTRYLTAIVLVALLVLQGCGQTGDLYWPDDEQIEVDEDKDNETDT